VPNFGTFGQFSGTYVFFWFLLPYDKNLAFSFQVAKIERKKTCCVKEIEELSTSSVIMSAESWVEGSMPTSGAW